MFSPTCVSYDPLGIAGTLASSAHNCQWHDSGIWEVFGQHWTYTGPSLDMNNGFSKDGATPHTSNNTLLWLRQRFEDWPISRRCDIKWVPHMPEFYLWGYLKDWVCENNLQTISELKTAITARIRAILIEECVCVIDSFARCLQVCLQCQGVHLEHISERTCKLDYLTYKLEALWNDHTKTEVSVHQI